MLCLTDTYQDYRLYIKDDQNFYWQMQISLLQKNYGKNKHFVKAEDNFFADLAAFYK